MLVLSDDGSHTLISDTFHVSYHSKHGAITESQLIYIESGIEYFKQSNTRTIRVFEMGFGTGLNALLTCLWAEKNKILVIYHTIDLFPVGDHIISQLNYPKIVGGKDEFTKIHANCWETLIEITPYFHLKKEKMDVSDINLETQVDVIYFDAFGPTSQAHLWEMPILSKMETILAKHGILITYCAQGAFKRNLKSLGLHVENLPGPSGKREITRAIKN